MRIYGVYDVLKYIPPAIELDVLPYGVEDFFRFHPSGRLEKVVYGYSQWDFLSITGGDRGVEVEGRPPQQQVDCPTEKQGGEPFARVSLAPSTRFPREAGPLYRQGGKHTGRSDACRVAVQPDDSHI